MALMRYAVCMEYGGVYGGMRCLTVYPLTRGPGGGAMGSWVRFRDVISAMISADSTW